MRTTRIKCFIMKIKYILFIILVACVSSCEKDEEFTPTDNGQDWIDYSQLVSQHVKSSYYYSDFYVHITITSTLNSLLPTHSLKYGIEYGYNGNYDWEDILRYFNGGTESWDSPIFFTSGGYDYDMVLYAMYINSYLNLKKKIDSGRKLSKEEQELYDEYRNKLKDEAKVLQVYNGRVFVNIDGEKYYINKINLK